MVGIEFDGSVSFQAAEKSTSSQVCIFIVFLFSQDMNEGGATPPVDCAQKRFYSLR